MSKVSFKHREPIGSSTYPMPGGAVDPDRTRSTLAAPPSGDGISTVYVHIPFCDQICSFCGFNKFVSDEDVKEAYVNALVEEIRSYARTRWASSSTVVAVYLGGGTPNSLSADQLRRVLAVLRTELPLTADCEITCEGTPMNFDEARISALKESGVHRVSAGIQTFDRDIRLQHLHMREGKDELLGYVAGIGDAFADFNLDLIFNLPGQTDEIWADDLATALSTRATHLTVYPLVLLENTIFYTDYVKRDKYPVPPEDREIRLFEWTSARLAGTEFGQGRYTVRDWARPNHSCRYIATNAHCGNVIAFGAGAHGFIENYTYRNVKNVAKYSAATAERLPMESQRFCSAQQLMRRFMVMGLRLLDFDLTDFDRRFGVGWRDTFGKEIDDLAESGFLRLEGTRIRYTNDGLVWANNVRSHFEADSGRVVGYSDTPSIGVTGKDHYSRISRVKATDAETA